MLGFGADQGKFSLIKAGKGKVRQFTDVLNPSSDVGLRERFSAITEFSEVSIKPSFSGATGEFVPKLVAKKPITKDIGLTLQSEFGGNQVSEVRVDLSAYSEFNSFFGLAESAL